MKPRKRGQEKEWVKTKAELEAERNLIHQLDAEKKICELGASREKVELVGGEVAREMRSTGSR